MVKYDMTSRNYIIEEPLKSTGEAIMDKHLSTMIQLNLTVLKANEFLKC